MEAPSASDFGTRSGVSVCGGCRLAEHCAAGEPSAPGPLRGSSFAAACLVQFLVPAVLALAGAAIAGGEALRQLSGGTAGLLLGLLIAGMIARRHLTSASEETCFERR